MFLGSTLISFAQFLQFFLEWYCLFIICLASSCIPYFSIFLFPIIFTDHLGIPHHEPLSYLQVLPGLLPHLCDTSPKKRRKRKKQFQFMLLMHSLKHGQTQLILLFKNMIFHYCCNSLFSFVFVFSCKIVAPTIRSFSYSTN